MGKNEIYEKPKLSQSSSYENRNLLAWSAQGSYEPAVPMATPVFQQPVAYILSVFCI